MPFRLCNNTEYKNQLHR